MSLFCANPCCNETDLYIEDNKYCSLRCAHVTMKRRLGRLECLVICMHEESVQYGRSLECSNVEDVERDERRDFRIAAINAAAHVDELFPEYALGIEDGNAITLIHNALLNGRHGEAQLHQEISNE